MKDQFVFDHEFFTDWLKQLTTVREKMNNSYQQMQNFQPADPNFQDYAHEDELADLQYKISVLDERIEFLKRQIGSRQ